MALFRYATKDELANIKLAPSQDQTQIYNTLNGNAAQNNQGSSNFFQKKFNSLENAIGTTLAVPASLAHDAAVNIQTDEIRKDLFNNLDDVYRKYGFQDKADYDRQVANADDAEFDRLINLPGLAEAENSVIGNTRAEQEEQKNRLQDYTENNYISKKINQDRGKFAGSAINTLSTAFDVMAPGAGIAANAVQGGLEGVAEKLEQNGFENFDAGRAGQNALVGAVTGGVVGKVNKGISGNLAKKGGNLFTGSNKLTQAVNTFGANHPLASAIATGVGRGAISGAVGGATGAGVQSALSGEDLGQGVYNAAQGAIQGAGQGALIGGTMAGANIATNRGLNTLKQTGQAIGDFANRYQNSDGNALQKTWSTVKETANSGDSWLGNRIADMRSKTGVFGKEYDMFENRPEDAIGYLNKREGGIAKRAVPTSEDGLIDLPYGRSDNRVKKNGRSAGGYGLKHLSTDDNRTIEDAYNMLDTFNRGEPVSDPNGTRTIYENPEGTRRAVFSTDYYGKKVDPYVLSGYDKDMNKKVSAAGSKPNLVTTDTNSILPQNTQNVNNYPQDIQNMRINSEATPETEVYRTLTGGGSSSDGGSQPPNNPNTSLSSQLRYQSAQDLLKQYGTIDKPTAKATNAPKTIQEIADAGFTKPGDVELMADHITGSNGEVNKLVQKLVLNAKPVNTFDGLDGKTLDTFIDDSIDRHALNGINEGKAVKAQINSYLSSLPSRREGSVSGLDAPEDVMGVIRGLEAEAANYEGRSGNNYGTTTKDKINAAQVAKDVATLLKERLFNTVDVKQALTPDVATDLKNLAPGNKKWSDYVDSRIMTAKSVQDLRAVQAPWVRAKKIIDNGYVNSMTYGGRMANSSIPTSKGSVISNVVNNTWNSNVAQRAKAKVLNYIADKAEAKQTSSGTPSSPTPSQDMTPPTNPTPSSSSPNSIAPSTGSTNIVTPSTQIYNAIGRYIGESQGNDVAQQYLDNATTTGNAGATDNAANNSATAVYDALNGNGSANAQSYNSSDYFVPPTGNYWADEISQAMVRAMNANDYDAFTQLYEMYQIATSGQSKTKDYSDPTNWSSGDRSKLLSAQDALSQIDELESAYVNATNGGGNALQGTLRGWANNLSGGNLDPSAANYNSMAKSVGMGIVKNLINLGVTEADAQRYLDYLPALTDTKEQATQKLETLRNIYQAQINNLYSAYGV